MSTLIWGGKDPFWASNLQNKQTKSIKKLTKEKHQALNIILINVQELTKQTRVALVNKEASSLFLETALRALNERFTARQTQRYSMHFAAGPASQRECSGRSGLIGLWRSGPPCCSAGSGLAGAFLPVVHRGSQRPKPSL